MNQTIYIRKEVWTEFEGEEEKSALVNQLLAQHYHKTTPRQDNPAQPLQDKQEVERCPSHKMMAKDTCPYLHTTKL